MVNRPILHYQAKISQQSVNPLLRYRDFCDMAAAAVLDFKKMEILPASPLKWAFTRQCAKFHHNRSNGCRDMATEQKTGST